MIIIGGGPAGLMAADVLSPYHRVSLYEKGKTVGRKFLVAGKGGFNLTNSAQGAELKKEYAPAHFLDRVLDDFDSNAVRQWLNEMGIPTFVGSSGRVFPEKGIKPVEVLNRIREKLTSQGVQFFLEHEFVGFTEHQKPILRHRKQEFVPKADAYIFALGGASWPVTGATGHWRSAFDAIGITTLPFQASNCGIHVDWPDTISAHHAGKPLKNVSISAGGKTVKGEALITDYGLEGNAIYPIVPQVRSALQKETSTQIYLDLKPNNTPEQLIKKLKGKTTDTQTYAKTLNLKNAQLALLKAFTDKTVFQNPNALVHAIKQLPIPVHSLRPVEEAISTIGGIPIAALNPDFSLKGFPHLFAIGEMVDWDTITGGFLLQACFAMGKGVGASLSSPHDLH